MVNLVFLWHFICLHWQHLLSYLAFINFCMPQTPGKDLITSLQEHVYYIILLYNLVCLKLKEGLETHFNNMFHYAPFESNFLFFRRQRHPLLLHHIQSVSLYCMCLYYIFILLQIYYIASVSYNWVFLACYTFTQLCFSHISETQHTTFP